MSMHMPMAQSLPPLPGFGIYQYMTNHGNTSSIDVLVRDVGPVLPTCGDPFFHTAAGKQLAKQRLLYWLSWYFFVAVLTVVICYIIHFAARVFQHFAKVRDPSPSYRTLEFSEQEQFEMQHPLEAGNKLDDDVAVRRADSQIPFLRLVVAYNVCCAGLVCVASWRQLLCPTTGLDWELWAVWQLGMAFSFVLQTILRTLQEDSLSCSPDFVKPVFMSMIPGVSEPIDTMRDWVVVGMCFEVSDSLQWQVMGAAWAILLLCVDFRMAPIVGSAFVPREVTFVTCLPVTMVVVALAAFTLSPLVPLLGLLLDRAGGGGYFGSLVVCIPVAGALAATGTCLGVMAIHCIIASHFAVFSNPACSAELAKSYLSILNAPTTTTTTPRLSRREWLLSKVFTIVQDITSNARLVIAWNEDAPQGVIGFVLASKIGSASYFACFSAALSIMKGFLIPLGRALSVSMKHARLTMQCSAMSAEFAEPAMQRWRERNSHELLNLSCACRLCQLLKELKPNTMELNWLQGYRPRRRQVEGFVQEAFQKVQEPQEDLEADPGSVLCLPQVDDRRVRGALQEFIKVDFEMFKGVSEKAKQQLEGGIAVSSRETMQEQIIHDILDALLARGGFQPEWRCCGYPLVNLIGDT
eukprot:TRINITY_DN60079_c0_g1_i2.p1 TRINITY_DN60079_c0_g1~~TRINITY_DN60079_c0_g1_i2.p1  ORF type:complete len:636 (-),score=50.32 TRINITY_DN60079_c0_g1_i2:260-2167(-)